MTKINEHKITIFVDGIFREFVGDDDTLLNNDWYAVIEDMLDTVNNVDKI